MIIYPYSNDMNLILVVSEHFEAHENHFFIIKFFRCNKLSDMQKSTIIGRSSAKRVEFVGS